MQPLQLNEQLPELLKQLQSLLVLGRFDVLLLPHGPLLSDLKRVSWAGRRCLLMHGECGVPGSISNDLVVLQYIFTV
jgi:hypothetical protein